VADVLIGQKRVWGRHLFGFWKLQWSYFDWPKMCLGQPLGQIVAKVNLQWEIFWFTMEDKQ
jgi:hypothetical protein